MKILIPLKQVPDSTVRVSVAPDRKSIKTEGITWSISPYDEYAIEMALERKDADPTTVVAVVTVGPARSRERHAAHRPADRDGRRRCGRDPADRSSDRERQPDDPLERDRSAERDGPTDRDPRAHARRNRDP